MTVGASFPETYSMRVLRSNEWRRNEKTHSALFLVKTFARDVETNGHLGPNVEIVIQEYRKDNLRAGDLRVAPKRNFSNVGDFRSVEAAVAYAQEQIDRSPERYMEEKEPHINPW